MMLLAFGLILVLKPIQWTELRNVIYLFNEKI